MVNNIAEYLVQLKRLLNGRIPAEELGSLLSESKAHLEDLKSDMSSSANAEQLAVWRFGNPKAFALRVLKDRRQTNIWKATIWPMAILVGFQVARNFPYGELTLVVSNGQPMHPFSFMFTPLGTILGASLFLFFVACFKARRLFPLQIAIFALIFGGVGAFRYSTYGPIPTQGRDGIAYAEIPQDLERLADAHKAFKQGPLVFSEAKKALRPNSEFLVAGRYALPLWFLEKGVRGSRLFINNQAPGWGIQVYQPTNTLPDPTMFTTTDWNYAAAVWTTHFLKSYEAELESDMVQDRAALSLPSFQSVPSLSLGEQIEFAFYGGIRSLVLFFSLNLVAWFFGWMCDSALFIRRRYRRLA